MPHVDSWNSWFADIDNQPAGVPALRDIVDEACRDVGPRSGGDRADRRRPGRGSPGGDGRVQGDCRPGRDRPPLEGSPERDGRGAARLSPARGSRTSSSSWTRSRSGRSRHSRRSSRRSTEADSTRRMRGDPPVLRRGVQRANRVLASGRHARFESFGALGARSLVASLLRASPCRLPCGARAAPTSAPTPTRCRRPRPSTPDPHLTDPATANEVFTGSAGRELDVSAEHRRGRRPGRAASSGSRHVPGWPLDHQRVQLGEGPRQGHRVEGRAKLRPGRSAGRVAGLNILVEWGPTTGRRRRSPMPPSRPPPPRSSTALDPLLSPLKARSTSRSPIPEHTPVPSPSPIADAAQRRPAIVPSRGGRPP